MDHTPISVLFGFAYGGACLLYFLSFATVDFREKVQRLVEPRTFSPEEATRDFGYAPMQLQDGLKGEVEEYLQSKIH